MKALINIFTLVILWSGFAKADIPAVHGMLLFGQSTTYASHLPMFHHPHDYQLIMELKLANTPRSQTLTEYEFLKKSGETFFTLVPEKMDLAQVISGGKKTFQALIYHGHFEKGGKNLGPVKVAVDLILLSKKLDPALPPKHFNEYMIFGKNGEYFAAHVINSKPSFDGILSVTAPYKLSSTICRTRACKGLIPTPIGDDKLPLFLTDTAQLPVEEAQLGDFAALVNVKKVLYLEEDELQH